MIINMKDAAVSYIIIVSMVIILIFLKRRPFYTITLRRRYLF